MGPERHKSVPMITMVQMVHVGLRLDPDAVARVDALARALHGTRSQALRYLIEASLTTAPSQPLPLVEVHRSNVSETKATGLAKADPAKQPEGEQA